MGGLFVSVCPPATGRHAERACGGSTPASCPSMLWDGVLARAHSRTAGLSVAAEESGHEN
jgi:hypothetical protein